MNIKVVSLEGNSASTAPNANEVNFLASVLASDNSIVVLFDRCPLTKSFSCGPENEVQNGN